MKTPDADREFNRKKDRDIVNLRAQIEKIEGVSDSGFGPRGQRGENILAYRRKIAIATEKLPRLERPLAETKKGLAKLMS